MTTTTTAGTPGVPVITNGELISTSPATGEEVGRFPVAGADEATAAVGRAHAATAWWQGLGYDGRKQRLLRWRASMARRMDELIDIMHAEGGKPRADSVIEIAPALDHIAWSARNAKRVLRCCWPSSPRAWSTSRWA
jgi:succinate-semialdehyde dehydrogenase / glutarate-semialdehyde dehydrogenase